MSYSGQTQLWRATEHLVDRRVAAKYSVWRKESPWPSQALEIQHLKKDVSTLKAPLIPTLAATEKLQIISVVLFLPQHEYNLSISRLLFPRIQRNILFILVRNHPNQLFLKGTPWNAQTPLYSLSWKKRCIVMWKRGETNKKIPSQIPEKETWPNFQQLLGLKYHWFHVKSIETL